VWRTKNREWEKMGGRKKRNPTAASETETDEEEN